MKAPSEMSRAAILAEGALMVALAAVLSAVPVIPLPFGGSVTAFSTVPILMMSFRHGGRWGCAVAAVYSLLQMMQGISDVMILKTLPAMLLCAALDYIAAYTALGLAGPIARLCRRRTAGIFAGVAVTGIARLGCSFISGIVLWRQYAEGMPVWLYSISYNASWCLPDVAAALAAVLALARIPALAVLNKERAT